MIAISFRRPGSERFRLVIDRDDDAAVDFVLACACRHFGDPSVVLPFPPPPPAKKKARD